MESIFKNKYQNKADIVNTNNHMPLPYHYISEVKILITSVDYIRFPKPTKCLIKQLKAHSSIPVPCLNRGIELKRRVYSDIPVLATIQ